MFTVEFAMGRLTCDPEYPNYDWTTVGPGTYEATPAVCQPSSKSEISEGEGAVRLLVMIGISSAYD